MSSVGEIFGDVQSADLAGNTIRTVLAWLSGVLTSSGN